MFGKNQEELMEAADGQGCSRGFFCFVFLRGGQNPLHVTVDMSSPVSSSQKNETPDRINVF